eukprot:SAG25_NODE_661_length_6096_cov_3.735201_2_plen_150_part_00
MTVASQIQPRGVVRSLITVWQTSEVVAPSPMAAPCVDKKDSSPASEMPRLGKGGPLRARSSDTCTSGTGSGSSSGSGSENPAAAALAIATSVSSVSCRYEAGTKPTRAAAPRSSGSRTETFHQSALSVLSTDTAAPALTLRAVSNEGLR